jgi:autotransporter-associated beta strand protein
LGAQNVNFTNAGNNTFSGGVTLNQGALTVNNPFALGGGLVLNGQPVALGTPGATFANTGDLNLVGGQLNLRFNGGGINGTVIVGNPTTNGVNVNVRGPVTIDVNQLTANSGNSFQIGSLTMTENLLTTSGGNNTRLRVAGTTTLAGAYANFVHRTATSRCARAGGPDHGRRCAQPSEHALARSVCSPISGTSNSYAGGTNVMQDVAGDGQCRNAAGHGACERLPERGVAPCRIRESGWSIFASAGSRTGDGHGDLGQQL